MMATSIARSGALAAGMAVLLLVSGHGAGQDDRAAALVTKVLAAQRGGGYSLRARLVTSGPSEPPFTVQVRALGRREGPNSQTLYQALWPASVKGQAVSFEAENGRFSKGIMFRLPDEVTPLVSGALGTGLFGTELSVEDLAEDFWTWPRVSSVERPAAPGRECEWVELRPPAQGLSAYAAVRACISPKQALPLVVEKVDAGGKAVRRFTVEKAVRHEGHWVASRLLIENVPAGRTTRVEATRGAGNLVVSRAEFLPPRLRSLGR